MTGAAAVVAALTDRGETLATAESLTGGLLAATVVDVPGASAVLRGGLVVYALELKVSLAGVPAELLDQRGPVDPDVALAMARGARMRCGSTWALATTGVAGPEPHGGQPPGSVYVGLAGPGTTHAEHLRLPGGRSDVRSATIEAALRLLEHALLVA